MIRTTHAHLNVEAQTHPGMTGKNNEDRYAVASFQVGENDPTPVVFAALADGIGGHRGGEVAAELAVNFIMQNVARSNGKFSKSLISYAVAEASNAILSHAQADVNLKGMGSTCAMAWVAENRLHTAYVGDSRIYLIRGERIQQLTIDHSWVQEAMDKGILTPELARDHPNAHVIRRYLGSAEPPEPDFRLKLFEGEAGYSLEHNQGTLLEPDDIVLLCSDGLTDMVWDDEILEVLRANPNIKDASVALVDLANERGGHDNITLILLHVPKDMSQRTPIQKKKTDLIWWAAGGGLLLLFLLAAASVLTVNLLKRNVTVTPSVVFAPLIFPTMTLTPKPTETTIPTETASPDVFYPTDESSTLTPWPTNTIAP